MIIGGDSRDTNKVNTAQEQHLNPQHQPKKEDGEERSVEQHTATGKGSTISPDAMLDTQDSACTARPTCYFISLSNALKIRSSVRRSSTTNLFTSSTLLAS